MNALFALDVPIENFSGTTDSIILRRRRFLDTYRRRFAIPKNLYGPRPTMPASHATSILGIESAALEIVPEYPNCPTMVRPSVAMCIFSQAIQEDVGAADS